MAEQVQTPAPAPQVTGEGDGPVEGQPDRATVVAEIEAMIAAGSPEPEAADAPDAPEVEGEAEVDEKPPAAKPEETKPDEPTVKAARAILAAAERKERAALAREQSAKALEDKAKLADTMVSALLADPEAFLSRYGGGKTFDDLVDAHLEAGRKPEKAPESDDVKELRRRLDEREEREKTAAVAGEVAEQVKTIHGLVRDAKKGEAPRFARIAKAEAAGPFKGKAFALVTDMIVETAREGRVLTPFEAAQEIETFLAEMAGDAPTSETTAPPGGAKPTPRAASAPPTRAGTQTLLNDEIRDVPPATKELPADFDERREAVRAQMRAEGLISD